MTEDFGNKIPRKQTLLQKYDMLVDCLSLEYIEKCTNTKELENILKVLRSGEEGCYPHLEIAAREKLQKVSPNSRLLRVEESVVPITALDLEQQQEVTNDIQSWANAMQQREEQLKTTESVINSDYPAIRNTPSHQLALDSNAKDNKLVPAKPKGKALTQSNNHVPKNYSFWDKYDADKEVLKMDLEEERQADRKEADRRHQQEIYQQKLLHEKDEDEQALKNAVVGAGDGTTKAEREYKAHSEKLKGNECFKVCDLSKALNFYTRSICLFPTIDAYNNRALTYLKLEKYSAALEDTNKVLALDPSNIKGLYRRGLAWFNQKNYRKALDDFQRALELDPNNKTCQTYANKSLNSLGLPACSKRLRMAIHDVDSSNGVKIEEVDNKIETKDIYYPFFNTAPNEDIELNALGTAKVMCRCNGTPVFMKKVSSLDDIKEHGMLSLRRSTRSKKRELPNCKAEESAPEDLNKTAQENKTMNGNGFLIHSQDCGTMRTEDCGQGDVKQEEISNKDHETVEAQEKWTSISKDATPNMDNLKSPYFFSAFWSSIKGVEDLATVAKALNILQPEQIVHVVHNKLDENMLSLFIQALHKHFSLPADWGVVQRYLHSFTQLPRFNIVQMMMDSHTKRELESLLNEAEEQGLRVSDLFQLYGLTHCPTS